MTDLIKALNKLGPKFQNIARLFLKLNYLAYGLISKSKMDIGQNEKIGVAPPPPKDKH